MPCLNDYDYEVLLQHITYEQAEQFIREKYWETYYFEPGFRVLDLRLLGDVAVPIAIDEKTQDALIFPYTKPCMGTFVLRFPGVPDEVKRIRSSYSKSLTLKQWTPEKGKKNQAVAITCPMDVSLRNFNYDILSHFRTLKECETYIREKFKETYYFEPGFKVLGLAPLGKEYIPVAVEEHDNDKNVIFPFFDSGMGALVIRVKGVPDEADRIRESYPKKLTAEKMAQAPGSEEAKPATPGKKKSPLKRIIGKLKGDQVPDVPGKNPKMDTMTED
jgi:hypothetical protein